MSRLKFKYTLSKTALKKLHGSMKSLKAPINRSAASEAGAATVAAIKESVARGSAPVAGWGKYKAYRGQYRKRIQKYGRIDGYPKSLQPVNLKVSGKFWDNLRSKVSRGISGYVAEIGFFDQKSKDMEKGHRTGWNRQAKRPIIPEKGETFAKKIQSVYLKVFKRTINELLKKGLK